MIRSYFVRKGVPDEEFDQLYFAALYNLDPLHYKRKSTTVALPKERGDLIFESPDLGSHLSGRAEHPVYGRDFLLTVDGHSIGHPDPRLLTGRFRGHRSAGC